MSPRCPWCDVPPARALRAVLTARGRTELLPLSPCHSPAHPRPLPQPRSPACRAQPAPSGPSRGAEEARQSRHRFRRWPRSGPAPAPGRGERPGPAPAPAPVPAPQPCRAGSTGSRTRPCPSRGAGSAPGHRPGTPDTPVGTGSDGRCSYRRGPGEQRKATGTLITSLQSAVKGFLRQDPNKTKINNSECIQ